MKGSWIMGCSSKRKKRPASVSITLLRKVAREALIDPRKPGPSKVLAELATPEYLETRINILLQEMGSLRRVGRAPLPEYKALATRVVTLSLMLGALCEIA
jgi:hypothetical protein